MKDLKQLRIDVDDPHDLADDYRYQDWLDQQGETDDRYDSPWPTFYASDYLSDDEMAELRAHNAKVQAKRQDDETIPF